MRRTLLAVAFSLLGSLFTVLLFAAGKLPASTHPIVEATADADNCFGGTKDGKWVRGEDLYKQVTGGEKYRLYSATKFLGTATGGKAEYAVDEPGSPNVSLTIPKSVSLPKNECVIAVGGEWNALPRPATVQITKQKTYQDAVQALLKAHGITKAPVNITKVIRVDFDGDKADEVFIAASTPGKDYPDITSNKNEYSLIVVRKVVNGKLVTIPVETGYYPKAESECPMLYTLEAVLDVNGDGVMEVVMGWQYYEGSGRSIYQHKDRKFESVLENGCGV